MVDRDSCIQISLECYRLCLETFNYCLKQGGKHLAPPHLAILIDCAHICRINADFLIRSSLFQLDLNKLSATLCLQCADSCDAVDPYDPKLRRCSALCRDYADACTGLISSPS